MTPDLHGTVRFYRTEDGGKKLPIEPEGRYYGCVAKLAKDTDQGNDVRLILGGLAGPILPGDTVALPMKFLTQEGADAMRGAGRFYLWEGRVIGEVEVEG